MCWCKLAFSWFILLILLLLVLRLVVSSITLLFLNWASWRPQNCWLIFFLILVIIETIPLALSSGSFRWWILFLRYLITFLTILVIVYWNLVLLTYLVLGLLLFLTLLGLYLLLTSILSFLGVITVILPAKNINTLMTPRLIWNPNGSFLSWATLTFVCPPTALLLWGIISVSLLLLWGVATLIPLLNWIIIVVRLLVGCRLLLISLLSSCTFLLILACTVRVGFNLIGWTIIPTETKRASST